jgi:regulator of RNase E activity RraA
MANGGSAADGRTGGTAADGTDALVPGFAEVPATTAAELVGRAQVMDLGMRPLWGPAPRVAGPAFTVRCPPGDNLMLHAAIHRAPAGSVLVVESGDTDFALAGGNVCAVARRNGVAALVADGVIRDLAEVRAMGFPVVARGIVPIPGAKKRAEPLNTPVRCGGVLVQPGDIVVADEEGVAVVPRARAAEVLEAARARLAKEAAQTLDDWEREHRARVDAALRAAGHRD